jgi:hypothetical protein
MMYGRFLEGNMATSVLKHGTALVILSLLLAAHAIAQQTTTTDTNCRLNGNTADCTSTSNTIDNGAQQRANQEAASALGRGLGLALAAHSNNRKIKKYCEAHPGADWRLTSNRDGQLLGSGRCPDDQDKAGEAVGQFMARHKDYVPGQANSATMMAFIRGHNLDPRVEKTYEHAYSDLKKQDALQLYSK